MKQKHIKLGQKYYTKGRRHKFINSNVESFWDYEEEFIPVKIVENKHGNRYYSKQSIEYDAYLKASDLLPFKCSDIGCRLCKKMGYSG